MTSRGTCCPSWHAAKIPGARTQSVNISLPEPVKRFVDRQIETGRYGSVSEYVRELIRADERRKAEEELETKLLGGLRSAERELSPLGGDGWG